MDIFRAVDEFVSSGIRLFKQLRGEGLSLSQLDLLNLAGQLRVLQIETTRLRNHQSLPLTTPRSTLPPILHISDRHSRDLYWDKALLLEGVITFIRVGKLLLGRYSQKSWQGGPCFSLTLRSCCLGSSSTAGRTNLDLGRRCAQG